MENSSAQDTPSGKINVLLAEDHKITAKLITAIIERSGKCRVTGVAENGRDVIELARKGDIDIIIMDINMPFVDGISAMESIFSFNSKAKIIILSGHTEAWIIKKSLNEGASGYITKLTDLDTLVEAIITVHNGGAFLDQFCMNVLVNELEVN